MRKILAFPFLASALVFAALAVLLIGIAVLFGAGADSISGAKRTHLPAGKLEA